MRFHRTADGKTGDATTIIGCEVTCFAPGSGNQKRSSLAADRHTIPGGLWQPVSGHLNFHPAIDRDGDHYAVGIWHDFIKRIQSNGSDRIDEAGD